jgi:hypothetical protein
MVMEQFGLLEKAQGNFPLTFQIKYLNQWLSELSIRFFAKSIIGSNCERIAVGSAESSVGPPPTYRSRRRWRGAR